MADKTRQPLFSEFPPVSTQEWMDKITADLKGADFNKKLVWKTGEGFDVNPFYRSEDLDAVKYLDSLPGEFPYVRGTKKCNKWLVRQDIVVNCAAEANQKAVRLIDKGVNSFGFIIPKEDFITPENVAKLTNGLLSDDIELNFAAGCGSKKLMQLLVEEMKKLGRNFTKVKGSLDFDPIGKLVIGEKLCDSVEKTMICAAKIAEESKQLPKFQTVSVNGRYFGNAGSTIVQELAFALSMGTEYMAQLTEQGLLTDDAAKSIRFNLSISSDYFMEIAKLRAGRLLWATIVNEFKPACAESCKMIAHCETSAFNMTVFDPYVNLLRSQTEAMSATLGGCNSLTVLPFNTVFAEGNEFSERIARNQQLLLKEESYFDKIVDAGAGSYYIETLTNKIADEAWKLFVEIESKGGFLAAFKGGFVQGLVKESAAKKRQAIASRREILLGTNQYPNVSEKVSGAIDPEKLEKPCACTCGEYEPIQQFRSAEQFEALRLATEKAAKRPKVFMLTYGNLAMRLARSQFSGNFFGCAGYEIIDNLGFDTVEAGVEAAVKANADVVVLCSSDDEYAEAAPVAFATLNNRAIFVVAGAPASMDELKTKGVEHFINMRSNVLETLLKFNEMVLK
ncbi:MAG: methylmalonyl-CoA mutase family protein [Cytophagaceae bacterium]|jgi:methylmalonyl-CoA mutase|nr:methylmalonyl-CoA mutase family protein [Cytophagaceae bacterium]